MTFSSVHKWIFSWFVKTHNYTLGKRTHDRKACLLVLLLRITKQKNKLWTKWWENFFPVGWRRRNYWTASWSYLSQLPGSPEQRLTSSLCTPGEQRGLSAWKGHCHESFDVRVLLGWAYLSPEVAAFAMLFSRFPKFFANNYCSQKEKYWLTRTRTLSDGKSWDCFFKAQIQHRHFFLLLTCLLSPGNISFRPKLSQRGHHRMSHRGGKLSASGQVHIHKKVCGFPVPSRDVASQTLPGRDNKIIPSQGRVWLVTSRLVRENLIFTVYIVSVHI